MRVKKNELDVDFIGGERSLTPKEEKALHEYFMKKKQEFQKVNARRKNKDILIRLKEKI